MGRWWEMVQLCGILFHLALGCDDGAGRFCGVQPGRYISQDARETYVVLWSQIGWPGDVDVCPTTEPYVHALVRTKGEWIRDDLWRIDCNGLE